MADNKYTVLSLFSGAMGLDIGLEKTGRFRVVACVEKESSFCDTIRANRQAGRLDSDLVVFERDIQDLEPNEILEATGLEAHEIDVIAGGPPCQSFSTAGRRRTTQDPRGTLLWQYLRFIDALRPKFFVMENVRGLLSAALKHRPIADRPNKGGTPLEPEEQPGSVVRLFSDDLQKIEGDTYHMDCFEVNAVNYGAPQLRERAIFIGNRFNAVTDFPNPTHGVSEPKDKSQQQMLLFDDEEETPLIPWATLRDAIGDLEDKVDPVIMDFSPRKKGFLDMIPPGSNWRSLPEDVQKESMGKAWFAKGGRSGWWRRLTFDLPCPTLVTMPNHASTSLCHPNKTRALTLHEYARIQEFPDEWEVCGKTSEQYAQIGNAVPVRLGNVTGRVIAANLDKLSEQEWKPYLKMPEAYRVIYVQSHIRTRQWFKAGKTFVWEDGGNNGHAKYQAPKTLRKTTEII